MSRATRVPRAVEQTVRRRAGGKCERCGAHYTTELHHRRFRSRGGTHTVENLVALCGWGNHLNGCHGFAHSGDQMATDDGWAISQWGPGPEDVPIRHHELGLVYLSDRGTFFIHERELREEQRHGEG